LSNLRILKFGQHDDAIKILCQSSQTGILFSGSWDKSVRGWDEKGSERNGEIFKVDLPDKVYSMDYNDDKKLLLVAMAERHICIYDSRKMDQPLQRRESSLKYQTRQVKFFPDGEGFICSSIEGRVSVEFIDPSNSSQQSRYAFKCHRHPSTDHQNTEVVYPVNSIAYHPNLNCFFTGGSDGIVNSWDRINRKRIRQFPKYPTSISSLAIDSEGDYLAIASSYCFEEGEKDHPNDSIFIRKLDISDVKSKSIS
jgi:cell cycle arrest protein BUB3